MSDWAFSLENAANWGDTDKCLNETVNFCDNMLQFYRRIQNTGIIDDITPIVHKKKMDSQTLHLKLEQLLKACNDFQAEVAEPIAKELIGAAVNAKTDSSLQEIHGLVLSFDYEQATNIIGDLLLSLK